MRKTILLGIVGGVALVAPCAANAQIAPGGGVGGPAAPAPGTVNSRDVVSANRERDAAFNRLAGDGVKVTDRDREPAAKPKKHTSAVRATAEDVKAGAQVRDIKGVVVGTIATLASNEVIADSSQIVIDTGQTKIGVPLSAFGKDDNGLILGITAEKFNQLVAQASASAPTPEPKAD